MTNLRVAGPTPFYPEVYKALQKEMVTHRGEEYYELHRSVVDKLRPFFGLAEQEEPNLYLLTSSGTGAMEAGVVNFHSRGDKILSFTVGVFGDRWMKIGKQHGAEVVVTEEDIGQIVNLEKAEQVMKENPDAKSVMITYCETSGTVVNDVKAFAEIAHRILPDALVMVDAISLLGAAEMQMDDWGIDVVVTGSQKAWSAPPGIAMIGISEKAKARMEDGDMGRFYFDLRLAHEKAKKDQTPTTPAVGSLYGLEAALEVMHREGVENVFKRHIEMRDMFREGVKNIGLDLVVDDEHASPTITAIYTPEGIDTKEWISLLQEKYDTVVSGGKGVLAGKTIRVAHMGNVSKREIDVSLTALESSLQDLKK